MPASGDFEPRIYLRHIFHNCKKTAKHLTARPLLNYMSRHCKFLNLNSRTIVIDDTQLIQNRQGSFRPRAFIFGFPTFPHRHFISAEALKLD